MRRSSSKRLGLLVASIALLALTLGGIWGSIQASRAAGGDAVLPLDQVSHPGSLPGAAPSVGERMRVGGDPAPRDASPGQAGSIAVRGLVLDMAGNPLSGADVEISSGEYRARTTTSSGGRYELILEAAAAPADLHVLAHWGRSAARRNVPAPGAPFVEVPALVLAPSFELLVRARADEKAVPGALVIVEAAVWRDGRTFQERSQQDGTVRIDHLAPGPLHLVVQAPGLEGRELVFVPDQREVEVELVSAASVEVVVLDAATGRGIAGADVEVREQVRRVVEPPKPHPFTNNPHTGYTESSRFLPVARRVSDSQGRARFEGLSRGADYELDVKKLGYSYQGPGTWRSAIPLSLDEAQQVVSLQPHVKRPVRWPVAAGEAGLPPDGARIGLRLFWPVDARGNAHAAPPDARIEGPWLVAPEIVGGPSLVATAPDGTLALIHPRLVEEEGARVLFQRPRQLDVLVRDELGAPLANASVALRSNARELGSISTGLDGRARFSDLPAMDLSLLVSAQARVPQHFSSVRLTRGDVAMEVALRESCRAVLGVVIDGVRRLPARYELSGGRVVLEDHARAELVVEVDELLLAGSRALLTLRAEGFLPARALAVLSAEGAPMQAELVLEPAGTLVARVRFTQEPPFHVRPERFDTEQGAWVQSSRLPMSTGIQHPNGPNGQYVFPGLEPGRWRVADLMGKGTSTEADLQAGHSYATVTLQLP